MSAPNGHAGPDPCIASRPLVLASGPIRVSIPVSTRNDEWIAAEVLREEFVHTQSVQDAVDATAELENAADAAVELYAEFLGFVASKLDACSQSKAARTAVLLAALSDFTKTHLHTQDIHTLVAAFDTDARKTVLASYYAALAALEAANIEDVPRGPPSALLSASNTELYALFGGQGTNEVYFDELQALHDTYTAWVAPFLTTVTREVLAPLAAANTSTAFYAHGLDVASWLSGASLRPPTAYLASVPLSLPLIGLTQLTQYLVACRVLALSPADMRARFAGATGHSQGVVSAVAIAASDSPTSFLANAKKALRWLFFCGLRGQEAFPVLALEPAIVQDAVEGGEGSPSPMLAVTGLSLKDLEKHIAGTNKHLDERSQLGVSLHNGPRAFVVTGPPKALYGLVTALRKVRAPSGLDQSKIPFSKRKPVFSVRFLVVGVPYHSPYLKDGIEKMLEQDLKGEELWKGEELGIPVYHTEDGSDLRKLSTGITGSLCEQIFTMPIHWAKATAFPESATHAVDFGPGGLSGIGPLTARLLEGRGVRVVVVGDKGKNGAELYNSQEVKYEQWWSKKWAPRLVKTSDGTVHLDTPFSRLLGKPPIMVAGMTPTTVKAGFVSAVLSAGYHVELAGGGHYNPAALRAKVAEIQTKIPPGVGLTLNALYINPRQFTFQFPLWQEMRREGLPIEGFCVAAGIPTTEKAGEIIEGLRSAGIRHVSFKPGSVDGIRQVVSIAAANPDFPVIMQWTGGRAGGHHSCEDFHQPILSTYGSIRQQPNIVLVGGSGFGGADDVWPYLTGEWSVEKFGAQPMPFDGFLFASRVMVAKEAHTSPSVKDLIVAASGVDDAQWEGTYAKETGGILTVQSELGEPIHKVATRGVKLWKEFDETVFKLPKEKRIVWLKERKSEVIAKLNRDFAKPWFGWKKGDVVAEDIADMTYEEVLLRMVRLMYVAHEGRWIDTSLRNLTGDWLRRTEERFAGVNGGKPKPSMLQSFTSLDEPLPFIEKFLNLYPLAKEQLLAAEDKAYFLTICQRPGQKPVPFIPVLDASFEVWFKKDSLWAAEDIEAVFDQDPQRVCILQGPVAAKHATIKDEPIKDMLDNITSLLVDKLVERQYAGDKSKIPTVDYLGSAPAVASFPAGVNATRDENSVSFSIGSDVPSTEAWLEALAGHKLSWLRAFLASTTVVQGTSYIDNPVRRLFAPRAGQKAVIRLSGGSPIGVKLFGAARSEGVHKPAFEAVDVKYDAAQRLINLTIFEDRRDASVPLLLQFKYTPETGYAPIREVAEGRNQRIKEFYWKLWFGDDSTLPALDVHETFVGPEVRIEASDIETFCAVVGNQGEAFKTTRTEVVKAPMDFAIVTGWQAIMKSIFPASIDGDLLKLVHLTNGFKIVDGAKPLKAGDICRAEAKIVSVVNGDAGKTVKVKGHVYSQGKPVVEVVSSFLYRGRFTDYENTFETTEEPDYLVEIPNDAAVGVIQSKEWFEWDDDTKPLQAGTGLIFRIKSEISFKSKSSYRSLTVTGDVFVRDQLKRLVKVGTVDFDQEDCHGNPVLAYLQRHGKPQGLLSPLPNDGYSLSNEPATFVTPSTNEPYSKVSGDFNPIHINPYFSNYASLPGTITHGMWSSAATRRYVETIVAQGNPDRVKSYEVAFVGMVLPGDELNVKLRHIGMRKGNMAIKVETFNQRGDKVLDGSAEVAQPTTVYVFTGQGSQEPGMGMELYNTSPAARAVWDAADAHLTTVYGFSIIDIVKNNPKEKTVHFGGLKGQAIRQRYMEMTYDTMDRDGNIRTLPLFGDINIRSPQYTFSHPNGLLFATQFAQIALVVVEKAAFECMRAKGFVQPDCAFAGHSLGEYSALASIADVLPISSLVDVVFYRGITMQRAVERDEHNRSNYAMCAVNPSRISPSFSDAALREVVDAIAHRTGCLLEIVNYNVEGQQYVTAGELIALQTLTNVLNYLKVQKVDIAKLTEQLSIEKVKEMLAEIIDSCYQRSQELQKAEGYITLERGLATIPLPGIDVPFHSRYLWAGVMPFRAYLSKKINAAHLNPDMLIGKYVPNLIAKPFEVSREYAQIIYDQTSSPRLDKVLRNWEEEQWAAPDQRQKLAYTILVELLAYQFASPVRWIETQDILFTRYDFDRFIEIGPSPTLTGMVSRTLKAKYESQDDSHGRRRTILCHAKHTKEIYYQFEDAPEEAAESTEETPAEAPVAAAATPVAAAAAPAPAAAAASVEDVPIKPIEILTVIVAQKLKKKADEVPLSKSIKDLVGGKSTLQNEILGDLQLEFSSAPEKGEELPLEELGSSLTGTGGLGKYTSGLVSRLVGGKMPGGFNISAIKSYLSKSWGLGPSRADGVLLLGTTMEPPKRLGSEAEGKAWLDSVVAAYAQRSGISLSSGAAAGAGGGGGGGAVINSEEFLKFQAEQEQFVGQQIELFMRYLKKDSRAGELAYDKEKATVAALQAKLDSIAKEHGDSYIDGIQPVFDPLKARHFDSAWNWVRQDALLMFYDIIFGRLTTVDREITARCIAIMNRADPALVEYMQFYIDRCDPTKGATYKLAKEFGQQLIDNCKEVVGHPPLYKDVTFPTAPRTEVTEKGDIVYSEVNRENVRKLEAYVEEMSSGDAVHGNVNINKVHEDVLKLWNVVKSQPEISEEQKNRIKALYEGVVKSLKKPAEPPRPRPAAPRKRRASSQFLRPQISGVTSVSADKIPLLHLKRKVGTSWEYSSNLTGVYLDVLHEIATSGTTFKDKNALLTGVGKDSIGVEIVKGLLSGGAHVVITTSRYNRSTVEYYQGIFQVHGSRGSALTVVPFNQGSKQDVEALVDYVYDTMGLDLDYILPFAAIPENGREIDGLDDRSELAHRIMLVNLLRILGAVKTKKASRRIVTRPTQVILPLSPNHGLFGNDGLYSESKISLETLFNRWASESWGEYLCLAGAVIGWTRGTALMAATNMVAQDIESYGVRTFSSKEMAFNILGLMHPLLFSITQVEPIWADLNGGMDRLPDLADITTRVRQTIQKKSELRRAIARDNAADFKVTNGTEAERVLQTLNVTPRANFRFEFPNLESPESLANLSKLQGLIDLDQVVVITGFAEVGPWGSSRTRWEMEARGELTIEGCIEMAWMMGYIKHFDGRLKDGTLHVGWVDAKTGEPVDDKDVRGKYEQDILKHAGVRLIEPELFRGYDPKKKVFRQEIELTHDLEPLEVSQVEAEKFKHEHGDKCDIWAADGDQWFAKLKKGARILVPKAAKFSRTVAGQIPTGWNAGRYGIPDDIVAQVDRSTLWALVSVAEALNMSGITDPYELYKHVHPSEVGSSIGSGMGGMESLSKMFTDRREEKEVQNDILQETFINTVAGWVNLLLLSSSGPIKIPVGACATALQSLEIACDTLLSGKAKVMLAGGYDDLSEEGSYEFANMKATSNAETEFAMGREPTEMSRPTTTTRSGFMEAQGTGVHVVMTAKTALELGAPIRGIVGFTSTSTDKAGRSVPAPGRGALTVAREVPSKQPSLRLNLDYRARQLAFRRRQISQWLEHEQEELREEVESRRAQGEAVDEEYIAARVAHIEQDAARQEKDAMATFGMLQGASPEVAPLRRALAVWGLTADDVGVLSIHGTSTGANEKNETHIWNDIFTTIGRSRGNAVPVMAQKSLVGHSKGGSAAWQLAGLLQSVITGVVPGNRNADNIDALFEERRMLMFPSKSIHTDGIRCGVMSSFGFGQVGGTALVLHPRYLFAALKPEQYSAYKARNRERALLSYKAMSEMMITNSLVKIKEAPPYTKELEAPVLLNPLARASLDPKTGSYVFPAKLQKEPKYDTANVKAVEKLLEATGSVAGVGVDQELISAVPSSNPTFVSRNFTDAEVAYCRSQPAPDASFAARWAGKEAVFKSLGVASKGAAAGMKDIEILPNEAGVPTVVLHGEAKAAADAKNVAKIHISLSHSETVAIAFAQAVTN
ncbi:fatty acid synthase [Punctularia strigosozonata HHB-11173 SS5]|uniref:fatty acid synthase n=1 Tax=Punctularia strigosozonata (strain HHB-11173) TaxID=741275 RepID=UPI00044174CC|nr:fatty acid synthase [Punctularia strigosozonata HHB-11173 SS5]EIN09976.1 fatty acid synthase [Punctularia strigosozonata HHB-11173 SS5]